DLGGGARHVLHHDVAVEVLGERPLQRAADDVVRAARSKGHDHANRLARIALRMRRAPGKRAGKQDGEGLEDVHAGSRQGMRTILPMCAPPSKDAGTSTTSASGCTESISGAMLERAGSFGQTSCSRRAAIAPF